MIARARLITRRDSDRALVLPMVLALVLGAGTVAALILPDAIDGQAALLAVVAGLAGAYLLWPKPALLAFALVMLFSRTLARWLAPELAHIDEALLPALIVLAALRTRPWRTWRISWVRELALTATFACGVAAALLNGVPATTWGLSLLLLAKVFAFFYVVLWHDFDAQDIRAAAPTVLAVGATLLVVGALEALDPDRVRQLLNLGGVGSGREDLPSIKSLLWHPSAFAWFAAWMGLFLTAGFIILRRWWMLVGGILFSAATVLSARRRALVGIALALGGAFAASLARLRVDRASRRAWTALALAVGLLGLVFLPSLVGLARLTVEELADSNTARVALYRTSVEIARDEFPLGVGLGRFGSSTSRKPYSPVYAQYGIDTVPGLAPGNARFAGDAFWARVLGETGVFGTAGLLVFTAALTIGVWRAARASYGDALAAAFTLGAWMVMLQTLVETIASSMFDSPTRSYLFFGSVAVALALHRGAIRRGSEDATDDAL